MKKLTMILLSLMSVVMGMKAQVGYQIALLNTATGEARANETVTVSITLSNNAGEAFYSETKSATTNDFGILSLTIGNADTFANVDFSKMPFFIEVKANGVTIGKSQMLSVPVAEVAKKVAPIDKSKIAGTYYYNIEWYDDVVWYSRYVVILNNDMTATYQRQFYYSTDDEIKATTYVIEGNRLFLFNSDRAEIILSMIYINGKLYFEPLGE